MINTKLSLINTVVMKGIRSPKARPAALNAIGDIPISLERFGSSVDVKLGGTIGELIDMHEKNVTKRKLAKFILTHSDWESNMPPDYWPNVLGLLTRFYVGRYEIPTTWVQKIVESKVEYQRKLPVDVRDLTVLLATIECSKYYKPKDCVQSRLFEKMRNINGLSFELGSHEARRREIVHAAQAGLIERMGLSRYTHRVTTKGKRLVSRVKRDFMSTLKYHGTYSGEYQTLLQMLGGKPTDEQERYIAEHFIAL